MLTDKQPSDAAEKLLESGVSPHVIAPVSPSPVETLRKVILQYTVLPNIKVFAAVFLSGIVVFRGFQRLANDKDSCCILLNEGRFRGDGQWQPSGCMVHTYNTM